MVSEIRLIHDNASSHRCEDVNAFLASGNVLVVNHASYAPDLVHAISFLFPMHKEIMLSGET